MKTAAELKELMESTVLERTEYAVQRTLQTIEEAALKAAGSGYCEVAIMLPCAASSEVRRRVHRTLQNLEYQILVDKKGPVGWELTIAWASTPLDHVPEQALESNHG